MCCFSCIVNQIGVLKKVQNIKKDPATRFIQVEIPSSRQRC